MARVKSCWTCRLRRKKCDQGQPACQACSALNIQCYYSPDRPDWMDGGAKQDEMTRRLKAQVKQGKERHYVQVLNIGGAANAASAERYNEHDDPPVWKFEGIPAVDAFQGLDVDFTMIYMDQVFPFLFPFYAPSMIQGGRAWVLDILRHNKTMFHAAMSLSTYFFTLVLSSENMCEYQVCRQNIWTQLEGYASDGIKNLKIEVLAMNQLESISLVQRARAMQSITQQMFLGMAMAKTNESSMHLAAAISIFEDILEANRVNDRVDMMKIMALLERPSWAPLTNQRPVWNTEQAALRFYFAILLWADVVSSTSLQTVPRLRKYYPDLISQDYGGTARDGLLRMEEYVGCEGWTLMAIAETAALDVWKQEEHRNGKLDDEVLTKRKEHIEGALGDGLRSLDERCSTRETQPQRIIQSFYRSSDPNHLVKQAAATRIWAHAARIYLAIVTLGWQPNNPSVRESASEVLRLLQELDEPAILRSAVWPFGVAGCVADVSQENGFRNLVAASGSLRYFGRLGDAQGIMQCVWSRRGELGEEWDMAACFGMVGDPVLLL
ncbi:Zn(2)-C6 fungal-type DNA-binding domain protein [Fusarium tjaetaba]|uniref:Zn(2)-C6 fungal-type DNA-binding domain protein n=1 Tax=Fusarium tjaetaba TaxID=1567544 RepID=A0A8H5QUK7_9HYPO|nr:Zn(2)-C6 fungal-type DNA-binding domain protein [Fusarium tjaetaba]KAF5621043.1 Zn(2)-C6 fungal-type DNA-binding domain protein [Fusarium tjaetaba]